MPHRPIIGSSLGSVDLVDDAWQTEFMPLRVHCPAGHKLIVPDSRAGKKLRCPRCDAEFVAGGTEATVSPAPSLPEADAAIAPPSTIETAAPLPAVLPQLSPDVAPVESPPPEPVLAPAVDARVTSTELPPVAEVAEAVVESLPLPIPVEWPAPELVEPPPLAAVETPAQPVIAEAIEPQPLPEPTLEPQGPPQRITPDRHWLPATYWLASGLIVASLFGIAPAVWDVMEYVQFYDEAAAPHVARWALLLFLLGAVQAAYAVYLLQLPDWTSVWVVTLHSLALAGLYALLLGLVLISRDDGWLVGPRGLQLADKLAGGQAALWCLAMTCVSIILAFFAGRTSAQWRRAELLVRSTAS